jgi:hypothetical protein
MASEGASRRIATPDHRRGADRMKRSLSTHYPVTRKHMRMKTILPISAFAILAGYAAPAQPASRPKTISYKEASAFELALLARGSSVPQAPPKLYKQADNKAEPCKLPTTQDQLDRPNFREYWDGECRNGFAFGLGRDIAISDTHHAEEITVHDGTGDHWSKPRVDYDYVNNIVQYGVGGAGYPAQISYSERMISSIGGFDIDRTISVVDELGKVFLVRSFAFNPQRVFLNSRTDGTIAYRFTDTSAQVADQNAVTFEATIVDPQTNVPGGVAMLRYGSGAIRHLRILDGKSDIITLPATYTDHLWSKYQEVASVTSRATAQLQRAEQIEREYLFKACNGKSGIKGLANSVYTKICTWRDQFKAPYALASANYQRQLESLRQRAATAEQERQIQLQMAMQQRMLQDQRDQQSWNQINQASQQLQQQSQQILQNMQNWRAPQVQPIVPPNGNKILCQTVGITTSCR